MGFKNISRHYSIHLTLWQSSSSPNSLSLNLTGGKTVKPSLQTFWGSSDVKKLVHNFKPHGSIKVPCLAGCCSFVFSTLVVDADVHWDLGGHGQEVVLQCSLQQSVVLFGWQYHLLFGWLASLQLVPQLLQSCHLSGHRCLSCCCLHSSHGVTHQGPRWQTRHTDCCQRLASLLFWSDITEREERANWECSVRVLTYDHPCKLCSPSTSQKHRW